MEQMVVRRVNLAREQIRKFDEAIKAAQSEPVAYMGRKWVVEAVMLDEKEPGYRLTEYPAP